MRSTGVVFGSFVVSFAWTSDRREGLALRRLRSTYTTVRAPPGSCTSRSEVGTENGCTEYLTLIMLLNPSSGGKMRRLSALLLSLPMDVELSPYAEYGNPSIQVENVTFKGATAGALLTGLTRHIDQHPGYVQLSGPPDV